MALTVIALFSSLAPSTALAADTCEALFSPLKVIALGRSEYVVSVGGLTIKGTAERSIPYIPLAPQSKQPIHRALTLVSNTVGRSLIYETGSPENLPTLWRAVLARPEIFLPYRIAADQQFFVLPNAERLNSVLANVLQFEDAPSVTGAQQRYNRDQFYRRLVQGFVPLGAKTPIENEGRLGPDTLGALFLPLQSMATLQNYARFLSAILRMPGVARDGGLSADVHTEAKNLEPHWSHLLVSVGSSVHAHLTAPQRFPNDRVTWQPAEEAIAKLDQALSLEGAELKQLTATIRSHRSLTETEKEELLTEIQNLREQHLALAHPPAWAREQTAHIERRLVPGRL